MTTYMSSTTARERFFFHNNLTCLVKALEGQYTTIDLRNDSAVTGQISYVDGYMNVTMDDAILLDPRGNEYFFDSIFVQARNIRYVHIPESVKIRETIQEQCDPQPRRPRDNTKSKNSTFKHKRAMRKHMETVASLGVNEQDENQAEDEI